MGRARFPLFLRAGRLLGGSLLTFPVSFRLPLLSLINFMRVLITELTDPALSRSKLKKLLGIGSGGGGIGGLRAVARLGGRLGRSQRAA